MPTILAIDPGLRSVGLALFTDGKLERVEWVKNPEQHARDLNACLSMISETCKLVIDTFPQIDEIAIEQQWIPPMRVQRVNTDDLLFLAYVVGGLMGFLEFEKIAGYKPKEWKKNDNRKKELYTQKLIDEMSKDELELIKGLSGKKLSDVVDAIGIGKFHYDKQVNKAFGV